jgi:hypothetical protein
MPPPAGRATSQPILEGTAAQAIQGARQRIFGDRPRFPVPVRVLTSEERDTAHAAAKDLGCRLCGGIHPLPNTPACPRVAEFKATSDGVTIIEAKFWQDGEWDASRVLFLVDAAEDPGGQAEAGETDGG